MAFTTAPDDRPRVELAEMPIRFVGEPVEILLLDMGDAGAIRVEGPAGVTYDAAVFDPSIDAIEVRELMRELTGPQEEIPGAAFPDTGLYTVSVTSLGMSQWGGNNVDVELDESSWFAAGTMAAVSFRVE